MVKMKRRVGTNKTTTFDRLNLMGYELLLEPVRIPERTASNI